jgi:hypothetical protein
MPDIDPVTGERIPSGAVKIDPATGERLASASILSPVSPKQGSTALDLLKGMGEGVINTLSGADKFATSHLPSFLTTPIGQRPSAENSARATAYAQDLATPVNTAQKIGKGVEQAGEFLIPGGAERALMGKGAGLLKTAAVSGLGSGLVNKLQGGSFAGGAAVGAAGAGLGYGIKALAAPTAETALGVRAADRAYGRTPGQAILAETQGVNPGKIAEQAYSKVGSYTGELEQNAVNSTIPANLQPSRDVASALLKTAVKRNNPATIKEVGQIGSVLDARPSSGPIPQFVPADEALALRRGIDDLHGSWSPNAVRDFSDRAVGATRSSLNSELEQAVPGFRDLNTKISTLLPVANRAGAADLNAGILQRVIGKAARPTGALVGSIAGGTAGYKEDGIRGALLGGGLGLIAPEVMTSPTTLMIGARAMDSPALRRLAMPALQGLGLQLNREK